MNETSVLSLRSWCCGASFGQHETTCPNYQPTPEKRVESGEPQPILVTPENVDEANKALAEVGIRIEQQEIVESGGRKFTRVPNIVGELTEVLPDGQQTDWAEKEAREYWDAYHDRSGDEQDRADLAALLRRVREADCKLVCKLCAGKSPDANVEPFQIQKDDYIPNFGPVDAGDWIHRTDWGGHYFCTATAIRKGER